MVLAWSGFNWNSTKRGTRDGDHHIYFFRNMQPYVTKFNTREEAESFVDDYLVKQKEGNLCAYRNVATGLTEVKHFPTLFSEP